MAKRIIQECDLTKREFDPDEAVKITITRDGKKGRTYELAPATANKLEQQLVGGKQLPEDWSFSSVAQETPVQIRKGTLGDLEAQEEDRFVSNKKNELREAGVIDENREEPNDKVLEEILTKQSGDANRCKHLKKGRVETTLKNGKRFAYRNCHHCHSRVAEMTVEERKAFTSGNISGLDVRARDLTN